MGERKLEQVSLVKAKRGLYSVYKDGKCISLSRGVVIVERLSEFGVRLGTEQNGRFPLYLNDELLGTVKPDGIADLLIRHGVRDHKPEQAAAVVGGDMSETLAKYFVYAVFAVAGAFALFLVYDSFAPPKPPTRISRCMDYVLEQRYGSRAVSDLDVPEDVNQEVFNHCYKLIGPKDAMRRD